MRPAGLLAQVGFLSIIPASQAAPNAHRLEVRFTYGVAGAASSRTIQLLEGENGGFEGALEAPFHDLRFKAVLAAKAGRPDAFELQYETRITKRGVGQHMVPYGTSPRDYNHYARMPWLEAFEAVGRLGLRANVPVAAVDCDTWKLEMVLDGSALGRGGAAWDASKLGNHRLLAEFVSNRVGGNRHCSQVFVPGPVHRFADGEIDRGRNFGFALNLQAAPRADGQLNLVYSFIAQTGDGLADLAAKGDSPISLGRKLERVGGAYRLTLRIDQEAGGRGTGASVEATRADPLPFVSIQAMPNAAARSSVPTMTCYLVRTGNPALPYACHSACPDGTQAGDYEDIYPGAAFRSRVCYPSKRAPADIVSAGVPYGDPARMRPGSSAKSPIPAPVRRNEALIAFQSSLKELGAPPSGPVLVQAASRAGAAMDRLPPLPERRRRGSAGVIAYLAVALGALAYRFTLGRSESPARFEQAGTHYPMEISQRGILFSTFRIVDGCGGVYSCEFVRVQRAGFLIGLGLCAVYFLSLELGSYPTLAGTASALGSATLPLMMVCFAVIRFYPKKLRIFGADGAPLCEVRQRWTSFFPNRYELVDKDGAHVATIERRVPALPRKQWRLKRGDEPLLDIREDSFANSLARRMLGHLWGLLRTDFLIFEGREPIGMVRRSRAPISNFYPAATLFLRPPAGLSPLWTLAAVLCVEVADSDRWHPWYG